MTKKTNFDRYLDKQLKDPSFKERFERAGEAWDVALKLAALRKEAGLSQKELAQKVGTSQQQISRLESPSYEGHSLSMLRRIAGVLGATVHVDIQRITPSRDSAVAEPGISYDRKATHPNHKQFKSIVRRLGGAERNPTKTGCT
jgi:transcriptional regulator with XRE-family HTH domain